MTTASFCIGYLGMLLWYTAAEERRLFRTAVWRDLPPRILHVSGSLALGLALGLLGLASNPIEAVLVWSSALMLSGSVIAIASPVSPRFVQSLTVTAMVAAVVALFSQLPRI